MSRLKIKKLSTGVTTLSLSGEKLSPHIIRKYKQEKELKKEKRKKEFPDVKSGNGSTPENSTLTQPFFVVAESFVNGKAAGVDLDVSKAQQKNSVAFGNCFLFLNDFCEFNDEME